MDIDEITCMPSVYMLGFDDGVMHEITRAAYNETVGFHPGIEVMGVLALEVDGVRRDVLLAEDPEDGHRSWLAPVVASSPVHAAVLQLASNPQLVQVTQTGTDYQVVARITGHVWLEFGTEGTDGYYPCAYYRWNPAP